MSGNPPRSRRPPAEPPPAQIPLAPPFSKGDAPSHPGAASGPERERGTFTRFRAEVLARAAGTPRDGGAGGPERRRWRAWALGLAHTLDRIYSRGLEALPASQVVFHAFRAFLPLADPRWWRAHPPQPLNHDRRRRLRKLRKRRRRAARGSPAPAGSRHLGAALYDAIEVYVRAADEAGVERCLRLADAISVVPAGVAGALFAGGEITGRERRPARCGPASKNGGASRHDAGP